MKTQQTQMENPGVPSRRPTKSLDHSKPVCKPKGSRRLEYAETVSRSMQPVNSATGPRSQIVEHQPEASVWERTGQPGNLWVIVAACTALAPPILLILVMLYGLVGSGFEFNFVVSLLLLGAPTGWLVAVGIFLVRRICHLELALKLYLPNDPSPPPLLCHIVRTINKRERQAVVVLPIVTVLIITSIAAGSGLLCYRMYQTASSLRENYNSYTSEKLPSRDEEIANLKKQKHGLEEHIERNSLMSASETSNPASWSPTADDVADEISAR